MKRVFVDTNIVLDFLLEREPFGEDAVRLFAKIDADEDYRVYCCYYNY